MFIKSDFPFPLGIAFQISKTVGNIILKIHVHDDDNWKLETEVLNHSGIIKELKEA